MKINGNIAEFRIDLIGESSSSSYLGVFETKCILSIGDEIEADKHYRNLLGDNMLYANQDVKELAFALSQLKVRIISSPFFWKDIREGFECEDKGVVFEILNKSIEAQGLFLEQKQKIISEKKEKLAKMLKSGEIEQYVEKQDESELE